MSRIDELIKEPRMWYNKHTDQNSCVGLYELIQKYVRSNFIVAEIGSFSGVSTELFALNSFIVYSIDPYKTYCDIKNSARLLEAESRFIKMQYNYPDKIIKMKISGSEAGNDFSYGYFDLVYIDGEHSYSEVKRDIKLWLPRIKQGGYLSGHDISFNSVGRAVKELLGEVETFKDTSWIFRKS